MKSVQLVFGTHNHQLEGDHPSVYEEAYQRDYKPFLSVLNSYPDFPAVLYYCGSLLEWMEEAHPEFLMLLDEMVRRKQVELLGGGFYEPILTMIPTSDKLGQMEKMTTYLRTRFGTRPRGCWLAHQVWEPGLVLSLRNSGMDFTFLEDRFFRNAGVEGAGLYYPRLTEDQGKTVVVFPICTEPISLRGSGGVLEPRNMLGFLEQLADEPGERVAVFLLDGQELGRDDLGQNLFEGGGLGRLLESLLDQRDWAHPLTPRRYLRQHLPRGRVYFPCLSDREEQPFPEAGDRKPRALSARRRAESGYSRDLALAEPGPGRPATDFRVQADFRVQTDFRVQVDFFRQHLTRIPEVNLLYSRMLYTHLLVNQIRGDKYRKNAARNELWKGQSSAVFWDTPSGGVWTNHLRKAAFRAYLEAEQIARVSEMFIPSIISVDFDMDGENEFLYQGEEVNAFVHLQGGVVFELDYLPVHWNYQDTLSRWPASPIPGPMGKGSDSVARLSGSGEKEDRYWRKLFIDHFFSARADFRQFTGSGVPEAGDFIDAAYEMRSLDRERLELVLCRAGDIVLGGKVCPLLLEKRFRFEPGGLSLSISLTSLTPGEISFRYATEINLALASPGPEDVRTVGVRGRSRRELETGCVEASGLDRLEVQDLFNSVRIDLSVEPGFDLWAMPIGTGPESEYQGSCYFAGWQVRLRERESWQAGLHLSFQPL